MRKISIPFLLLFFSLTAQSQDNIADAKANYGVDDIVTVTGIITNGDELGAVRYLQDQTAGIALYPENNWADFDFVPMPGDEVTITGTLSMFANLLEIGPVISSITLVSSGNELPEPIVLTPDQLDEEYEGRIVQIDDITFVDGGSIFGSTTYSFTNDAGEEGVIYINGANPILGELIPLGAIDVVGILSQHSYESPYMGYQVLPRSMDDFLSEFAINFTSVVTQTDLNTSSITLNWGTDVASSTGVFYGLNPDLGQNLDLGGSATEHQITIPGLESGMPYFCQVYSVADQDTAFSAIGVYSTISESSGKIRVYFNTEVDNSVSTGVDAISLFQATEDTIIAQIDRAQSTLDVAAYNINNGAIVDAINAAYNRGVTVRYIAEGQNANSALGSMNPNIPVLYRQNAISSGMHNKFLIVDAENVDSALVLTGSTNFTSNNLFSDPNNIVIIQDQALARAYTLEFNEMWGSSGPQPDPINSRFGENKIQNTPEKFLIGDRHVELYFSPSDGTSAAIAEAIETTDYDLDFAVLVLTNNIIADAILDQISIFVTPRGIVETPYESGSDFEALALAGAQMLSYESVPAQLHHKYAIIDYSQPESDPTVVTGSHNWSGSAETTNDENTLIIHDDTIANLFYQEFMALYSQVTSVEEVEMTNLRVYPNPADDTFTLHFESRIPLAGMMVLSDLRGRIIFKQDLKTFRGQRRLVFSVSSLSEGMYLVSLMGKWGAQTEKLMVTH